MLFFQQNQFWLLFKNYKIILKTRNRTNLLSGNICNHLLNKIVDTFWTEYYYIAHKKKRFVFFSVHRYNKYIGTHTCYLIFNSITRNICVICAGFKKIDLFFWEPRDVFIINPRSHTDNKYLNLKWTLKARKTFKIHYNNILLYHGGAVFDILFFREDKRPRCTVSRTLWRSGNGLRS